MGNHYSFILIWNEELYIMVLIDKPVDAINLTPTSMSVLLLKKKRFKNSIISYTNKIFTNIEFKT